MSIKTSNHDLLLTEIKNGMHQASVHQSEGYIEWNKIKIDGIGSNLVLSIEDGLLSVPQQGWASYEPFKNKVDKERAVLKDNKEYFRSMRINLKDSDGNTVLDTEQKVELFKKYLNDKMVG